ncbi:MAG: dTDP-4-dehydrorhamnose reductase [Vicinamibacterales bacterium]
MRVLVTGAAGQLGIVTVATWARDHEVVACTRHELDITAPADVRATIERHRPDLVLNCAAYNLVDQAEADALPALHVNAFAVRHLARAAASLGAVFVHYGTDFVYDGEAQTPYTEEDAPRPQSVYGASKLLGEWFALECPRGYVLRVESLFGGPAPRSSVDRIVDALAGGRAAPVFVDRVVSPSYVEDVAAATRRLVEGRGAFGLYHCVNDGHASWFDVGCEVARLVGASPSLLAPMRVDEVSLVAKRPRFCALSNAKLKAAGVVMPPWQDAVARYLQARPARLRPRDGSEAGAAPQGTADSR